MRLRASYSRQLYVLFASFKPDDISLLHIQKVADRVQFIRAYHFPCPDVYKSPGCHVAVFLQRELVQHFAFNVAHTSNL